MKDIEDVEDQNRKDISAIAAVKDKHFFNIAEKYDNESKNKKEITYTLYLKLSMRALKKLATILNIETAGLKKIKLAQQVFEKLDLDFRQMSPTELRIYYNGYEAQPPKNTTKIGGNVYAENSRFDICYYEDYFNTISKNNFTMSLNDCKRLLAKLTRSLKSTQWLQLSTQKYYDFNYVDNDTNIHRDYFKPTNVSWYSKGDWLFHEIHENKIAEIILIEVDYEKINKITGKNAFARPWKDKLFQKNYCNFMMKYGTENKLEPSVIAKSINWNQVLKDNDGFTIYPLPSMYFMLEYGLEFMDWDVSTLVLKNCDPIINHYNLGKLPSIYEVSSQQFFKQIEKLITKINKINGK